MTTVLAVLGAAATRQLLSPALGREAPMLIFVAAVAVSAVRHGVTTGLLATVLSLIIGSYLFVVPRFALLPVQPEDWARAAVFLVEGITIAIVGGRLAQQRFSLEEMVRRRTSELQASNEALEGFAHTISHDLRAPLRSMRGFAEILQEDFAASLPPPARDYTQRIAAAAQRLDALVDNLLTYARLNRVSAAEPVSLRTVMDTALGALQQDLTAAGATITCDPPQLGVVRGHRDTIEMMVLNLLSNALKFVPQGRTPRIAVSARRTNGTIRFAVRDNGIGVPRENQQMIFKPFERLNARDGYPGTGLGLAIVARGAERMEGRYGVDSEGTGGSEFWFELPAAPGEGGDVGAHSAR